NANTSPLSRARAPAREAAGNQRPWPADKVERWAIDRLIPYAKNARTHTDAQVAAIAAKYAADVSRPTTELTRTRISPETQQSHALGELRRRRLHRAAQRPERVAIEVMRMARGRQDQQ